MLLLTGALLMWSLVSDRRKTAEGARFAWNMAKQSGPTLVSVLALVSLLLAWLPPQSIQKYLGANSLLSVLIGAGMGSITILPGFVAFPLAKSLLERGAFVGAIAAFITTLTMVGFATLPLELKHFGPRFTLVRNTLSFLMALLIAGGMAIML